MFLLEQGVKMDFGAMTVISYVTAPLKHFVISLTVDVTVQKEGMESIATKVWYNTFLNNIVNELC